MGTSAPHSGAHHGAMLGADGGVRRHHPYRVDAVHQHEELVPGGRFVPHYEVHFTGPSGSVHSVQVPVHEAHPAEVDRRIQARLDDVEAIHQLGPEPHPENLAA